MANEDPNVTVLARVGDTGSRIAFSMFEDNGIDSRDLSACAATVAFWYPGAAYPHVIRAALVDASNGAVIYTTLGDEFTTVGTCAGQATIYPLNWYIGSAGVGRSFQAESGSVVRFRVLGATA